MTVNTDYSTQAKPFVPSTKKEVTESVAIVPPSREKATTKSGLNEEMQHIDSLIQSNVLKKELVSFSTGPQRELYGSALLASIYGNKKAAEKYVQLIKKGVHHAPNYPPNTNPFDSFFDYIFITKVLDKPQKLSELGLFESIGLFKHNQFLDDISPEQALANVEKAKDLLHIMESMDENNLSSNQKATWQTVKWILSMEVEKEKFIFHDYHINQLFGVLEILTDTLISHHQIGCEENINNYLSRLEKIPTYLQQAQETLFKQQKLGIVPPRFCIEKVIASLESFLGADREEDFGAAAKEHLFYTHFEDKLSSILTDEKKKSEYLEKAEAIIANTVYPAYFQLLNRYKELLEVAQSNHGVWALPNGDAYYRFALKENTTTDLSAEEIHELGLEEVSKIEQQMRKILKSVGIEDESKSPGLLMKELQKNPEHFFPNTEDGRTECLEYIHTILERCRRELWPLFDVTPKAGVEVKPVPKHQEQGGPAAYYYPPSVDGTRAGIYYINMRNMEEIPKYGLETLTVHEAEPGHHFHYALTNDLNLPAIMKITEFCSSHEGWALYDEKLAYERGFYSSPYDELGHLQDELLRAARLVLDTGIHWKRWTREEAIQYMEEVTGYTHDTVVTEVERYFVLPGQACSYKIGQLKILELREQLMERFGDKFSYPKFHNAFLRLGQVPMSVLEDAMNSTEF